MLLRCAIFLLLCCVLTNVESTFLSGSVFYEEDSSSMVRGITVTLTSSGLEGVAFTTATDGDGSYHFDLSDTEEEVGDIQNRVISLEYPFLSDESLVVSPAANLYNNQETPKARCVAEHPHLPDPES